MALGLARLSIGITQVPLPQVVIYRWVLLSDRYRLTSLTKVGSGQTRLQQRSLHITMATGERWIACCSKAETEVTRIAATTKIPALVVTLPVRVPHPEVRRCGRSANMAVGLMVAVSRGASCFDPADFLC